MAEPMSDRFLESLAQAVRIPTVSADAASGLTDLHTYLIERFPNTFDALEVERVGEGTLLLRWTGSDPSAQPVLLMAHQDVVPADATEWPHGPFEGATADGYLWGRGALDDKAALVGILEATESLLAEGHAPARDLYLLFGHDEEVGGSGARSAAELLASRGIRFEVVLDEGGFVLTDPPFPGLEAPLGLIGVAEKGSVDIELVADGEPGHSSVPPDRTAIGQLAEALSRVGRRPMPARLEAIAPLAETVAEGVDARTALVYRNLPRLAPVAERILSSDPTTNALIRTTFAPTMLAAGDRPNVLPSQARAVVNVRVLPGDTVDGVLDHLRQAVGDRAAVRMLEGGLHSEPSPISDHTSPVYLTLATAVEEVFPGTVAAPWVLVAATDSRHLVPLADQVLRFRPYRIATADRARIHGVGERIRLDDAGPAVELYRHLIREWCG